MKSVILRIKNKLLRKRTYAAYNDALMDCQGMDYENEDLVKTVYSKTKFYKEALSSNADIDNKITEAMNILISVIQGIGTDIWVLDFGGACGGHYFTLRNRLDPKYRLNWRIVETKNMCKHAKRLENSELRFLDDLEIAKSQMPRIDVLHVSGVLQSVDEPYRLLNSLLQISSKYILFSRMCFTKGSQDIITIQRTMLSWHGNGKLPLGLEDKELACPFTVMRKSEFDCLVQQGYKYQKVFADNSGMIQINSERLLGIGLLCQKV